MILKPSNRLLSYCITVLFQTQKTPKLGEGLITLFAQGLYLLGSRTGTLSILHYLATCHPSHPRLCVDLDSFFKSFFIHFLIDLVILSLPIPLPRGEGREGGGGGSGGGGSGPSQGMIY